MSFLETPRFPERVALKLVGGPGYSTDIISVRAGFESRNQNWSQALHRMTLSHEPLTPAQHSALLDHFHAVAGRAYGFRVKNWLDYALTQANSGLCGLHGTSQAGAYGLGHGVPAYQIQRRHTRGALTRTRDITKPAGTPTIYRGGVAVAAGAGAGQVSIDTTTGKVTFVADATRSVSAVTVGATTQVTVPSFLPTVGIGDRLYLTGLTGANAASLNNLSHPVTSTSGSTIYILGTNTSGQVITPGAGQAAAYPQPDETLTCVGTYDLPMRFTSDEMQVQVLDRGASGIFYAWQGVELVEVRP